MQINSRTKLAEEISKKNVVLVPSFDVKSKFFDFSKVTIDIIDFVECSERPVGLLREKIGGECFAPLVRSYLLCAGAR